MGDVIDLNKRRPKACGDIQPGDPMPDMRWMHPEDWAFGVAGADGSECIVTLRNRAGEVMAFTQYEARGFAIALIEAAGVARDHDEPDEDDAA
jgi:hypothetical protein